MELREALRIFDAFEQVRTRATGMRAAPVSWLPAPGEVVATALSRVAGEARELAVQRSCREAFVDIQAFVPDDEAVLVEARAGGPPDDERGVDHRAGSNGRPDQVSAIAVLEEIRLAQAQAISFLREDDRVQGALNALGGSCFAIGQARLSLEAVDRYKDAQTLGLASMVTWPIGLAVGLAAGSIMERPTIAATGAALVLTAAGWMLAIAPAWGSALGSFHSRLRRRAIRLDRDEVPAERASMRLIRGERSPDAVHGGLASHVCAAWVAMRRTGPVWAGICCMDASSGSVAGGERAIRPRSCACMHLRVTPRRRPPPRGRADPAPSRCQGSAVSSGGT